jgi:hypothetical protein
MDQSGHPSEHEDSHHFNLYDTYGTEMDDDDEAIGVDDTSFPIGAGGGWDHQGPNVVGYSNINVQPTQYDPSTTTNTTMVDFGTGHYTSEFQHQHSFEHDGHQYQDYMVQDSMGDEHTGNEGYDMNSMDLYNTPSIYPNLVQETGDYGT